MEAIHCAVIAESLQSGAEVCVPREAPYDICIDGIEEFPLPSQQNVSWLHCLPAAPIARRSSASCANRRMAAAR